tara:strand:+ start:6329 stop:6511 length:183 start_codon:yes stop_codon:yes gene_type:complete
MSLNNPDWKLLLMKMLNCFGEIENDWHEEYWRSFGISREEGCKILEEYDKFKDASKYKKT